MTAKQILAALLLASIEGSWWYDELLIRRLKLIAMGFTEKTMEYLVA